MKALPIGISTLSTIIQEEMVYIDKTEHAYALIEKSGRYFLSRPRRFGKSLFLDTLKEIFEGNEALFRGLYIHDKWDWAKKYPVIKIDFAGGTIRIRQNLDNLTAGEELLSFFEIDQIDVVTLLFQSGYLTIKKTFTEMGELLFQLTYPNIEVKRSLILLLF